MQFANPLAIRPKESDGMFPGVLSAAGPESGGGGYVRDAKRSVRDSLIARAIRRPSAEIDDQEHRSEASRGHRDLRHSRLRAPPEAS